MKLSVIIVTFNSEATIRGCLRSIWKEVGEGTEIYVVDNASSDGTVEIVKKFPKVKLIQNPVNRGFAVANNQAIRKARGNYILLLNPDAEIKEGSLEKMIGYLEKNPKVGILGPKLVSPSGEVQKEATALPTLLPTILWLFRLHQIPFFRKMPPFSYYLKEEIDYGKTAEVDQVIGAAFLVRRKVFGQVGLLDEDFFLLLEETEFCKRAKNAGWKTVYYPEAEVIHRRGATIRQLSPLKIQKMWNKGLETYFKKHGKPWEVWVLRFFFPLSYPAAVAAWLVRYFRMPEGC